MPCSRRATRSTRSGHRDAAEPGFGQAGELAVGLEKAVEGLGAVFDDAEAAFEVFEAGVVRFGESRAKASGDRLDGREGVVDLVAHDANETAPGVALLFAEGGGDLRQDDKDVGDAAHAEAGSLDHPAGSGGAAAEGDGLLFGGKEKAVEAEVDAPAAHGLAHAEAEDALGGVVEHLDAAIAVEGEDGGLHGAHDAFGEGDGVEGAAALGLQHGGEGVDLDGEIADGVVAAAATGAEGEVVFAQGGDDVGEGLQGAGDGLHDE